MFWKSTYFEVSNSNTRVIFCYCHSNHLYALLMHTCDLMLRLIPVIYTFKVLCNVRENWRANQEWTILRHWQILGTQDTGRRQSWDTGNIGHTRHRAKTILRHWQYWAHKTQGEDNPETLAILGNQCAK